MDLMSMSSGAMDSSSSGTFFATNSALAHAYWYIIVGVMGFMLLLRGAEYVQSRARRREAQAQSIQYPTKPQNGLSQALATVTAIAREISYPQLYFNNKMLSWMSPPPVGRILVILCYWAMIAGMMTRGAIIHDAYYWERIAYRSAWIGITQVPLVYLLASKSSVIGFLVGSSHERLNWLHRWVSRTLLITITVHGTFFFVEWVRADFVAMELSMMKMVRYGIGCWAILMWTTFSSVSPLRRMAYEIFVIQHLASAAIFLWLLYLHAPRHARYFVWFAVVAFIFDRTVRFALLLVKNIRLGRNRQGTSQMIGHKAELEANHEEMTIITIRDVHLSWRPGQHLYLQLPKLAPLESHPYTIANMQRKYRDDNVTNDIILAVRAHSGFSKRLYRHAAKNPGSSMTAFVTGPFGSPPSWRAFETVILLSASTGASFTLPILENILHNHNDSCIKRIDFLLAVRDRSHCEFYADRLSDAVNMSKELGINLTVQIAITGSDYQAVASDAHSISSVPSDQASSSDADEKPGFDNSNGSRRPQESGRNGINFTYGRPEIADFIRFPVEESGGETAVAVCGGKSLVAGVRNFVSALSNERAVHKGTGAQGIFLHVEEYCF